MKALNFKENNVQTLTLEELKSTIHENYSNGMPCGGIYHYALMESLLEMLDKANLKPEVTEIFAANNRDKYRPGVSIDDKIAADKGEGCLESHTLRRVYANINLSKDNKGEWGMNMAVAYHQLGIQVAFGPMVYVCHNQTILGARDVFTTQNVSQSEGQIEVKRNLKEMLQGISGYVEQYHQREEEISSIVDTFRRSEYLPKHNWYVLEKLMERRIRHDSSKPEIHSSVEYPLSSSQINAALERYLVAVHSGDYQGDPDGLFSNMSWWDALQCYNQDLKPDGCVIPSIIGQSYGLGDLFRNAYSFLG